MEIKPEDFKKLLPLPVTLITTISKNKIPNAAPYSCIMPILRPFDLIAIASALPRDTLRNIRETKEFVINVVSEEIFKKSMMCMKNYPYEVNELEEVGLNSFPSKFVTPPRVSEALGWIEVKFELEVSGNNWSLIIGKVVCAEINDKYSENFEDELLLIILDVGFKKVGKKIAKISDFKSLFSSIKI